MERDPQEIIDETMDGHMAFQVADKLNGTSFHKSKGSLISKEPTDKNVRTKVQLPQ